MNRHERVPPVSRYPSIPHPPPATSQFDGRGKCLNAVCDCRSFFKSEQHVSQRSFMNKPPSLNFIQRTSLDPYAPCACGHPLFMHVSPCSERGCPAKMCGAFMESLVRFIYPFPTLNRSCSPVYDQYHPGYCICGAVFGDHVGYGAPPVGYGAPVGYEAPPSAPPPQPLFSPPQAQSGPHQPSLSNPRVPNPFGGDSAIPPITRSFVRSSAVAGTSQDRRNHSIQRMNARKEDELGLPEAISGKKSKALKQEKGKGRQKAETPPLTLKHRILFLPVHVCCCCYCRKSSVS